MKARALRLYVAPKTIPASVDREINADALNDMEVRDLSNLLDMINDEDFAPIVKLALSKLPPVGQRERKILMRRWIRDTVYTKGVR